MEIQTHGTIFSFRFFPDQTWTLDLVNKLGQWMLTSLAVAVGFHIPAPLPWQFWEAKPNNNKKRSLPTSWPPLGECHWRRGLPPFVFGGNTKASFLLSSRFYCSATCSTLKSFSADEDSLSQDNSAFPHVFPTASFIFSICKLSTVFSLRGINLWQKFLWDLPWVPGSSRAQLIGDFW